MTFLLFRTGIQLSNFVDVVMYSHKTKRETALSGTPTSIQSKKITSTSTKDSLNEAKRAFGAVPINVDIPPKLAAYATESTKQTANCFFCATSTWEITATAIGSINRVVAVFVIHALRHPVTMMNPKMIFFGFVPTIFRVFNANLLWRFTFSIAFATRKPPINKKTSLSPYAEITLSISATLSRGNTNNGIDAVM